VLVPPENAAEAAVVSGLQVIPIANLRAAVGFLEGELKIEPTKVDMTRISEDDKASALGRASRRFQCKTMADHGRIRTR